MSNYQNIAILIIGNEILSGRTHELNAHRAAQLFFDRGCKVKEIAIIADDNQSIQNKIRSLHQAYDAVIISGGIGPTHDDITMQAFADAFSVPLQEHPVVIDRMLKHYGAENFDAGRRRMARIPQGATLIDCERTIAPGAALHDCYALAGVPSIFLAQLHSILHRFGDKPYQRVEIHCPFAESHIATQLEHIQQQYPDVEIGSYPKVCGKTPQGSICLSAQNSQQLQQAEQSIHQMLAQQKQ